jgi:hypothetical protein
VTEVNIKHCGIEASAKIPADLSIDKHLDMMLGLLRQVGFASTTIRSGLADIVFEDGGEYKISGAAPPCCFGKKQQSYMERLEKIWGLGDTGTGE